MGRATVRPKIWKYLTERPGEEIHVDTMASDLGLDRSQVQQGMRYLVDKNLVEQVIQGNSWRYQGRKADFVEEPVPVPEGDLEAVKAVASVPTQAGVVVEFVKSLGDLFEVVKCLNDGRLLLQDSEGVLYVAKKLET
jgi:hypothetical protein